jgi:hypothetical protein
MTTALIFCTVAALEVVAVLFIANALPRRHWLRLGITKFPFLTRRRRHT